MVKDSLGQILRWVGTGTSLEPLQKEKNSFQQVVLYTSCTKYAPYTSITGVANFEKINGQEEFDCSIFVFGWAARKKIEE